MTKAEQEERDRHEAWEKEQEKKGVVHLPRESESTSPKPAETKKPASKGER
jgi:hypothetical protein